MFFERKEIKKAVGNLADGEPPEVTFDSYGRNEQKNTQQADTESEDIDEKGMRRFIQTI